MDEDKLKDKKYTDFTKEELEMIYRMPRRGILFMAYPPDEEHPWWHYKNGFKAFGEFDIGSKISFWMSLISLAASILVYIKT